MKVLLAIISVFFIVSCGGGQKWQKNPIDDLIKELDVTESFSIILYDMDVEGNFTKTYKHQYKIVKIQNDVPEEIITSWYNVPEQVFMKHQEDMGLEIATKSSDGKISKIAAPPGFSNYVGNSNYGRWTSDGHGGSFWEFYGKYAMMSSLLNMAMMPARMSYWNDYRSNYYGSRPYYGPRQGGANMYGTQSAFQRKTSSNSRWASKSRTRNSNTFGSNKTTRTSSRWGSGTSTRSRGGGFGK